MTQGSLQIATFNPFDRCVKKSTPMLAILVIEIVNFLSLRLNGNCFVARLIIVRDAVNQSLLDFLLKSQTPVETLWSLRSIDVRVIARRPSFVKLRMPQNASFVPLINEPVRVNVFSFVIYKGGNSQYPLTN